MERISWKETAEFLNPLENMKPCTEEIEVRVDPLTGATCRIVQGRGLDSPLMKDYPGESEVFMEEYSSAPGFCPFCGERAAERTPGFIGLGVERFVHGTSVLFPNLRPYGEISVVNVVSTGKHFIPVDRFDPLDLRNSMLNIRDLALALGEARPDLNYLQFGMNYLPPAGSSMAHPHMQGLATSQPLDRMEKGLKGAKRHMNEAGTCYWSGVLEEHDRMIYAGESWALYAPYAPGGFNEIHAVSLDPAPFRLSSDLDLEELGELMALIMRYYGSIHKNALNMGLFALQEGKEHFRTHLRFVTRMPLYPYYRADDTFLEKMFHAPILDRAPEIVASEMREFLDREKGE